jgi:hypothetical protein
VNVSVQAIGVGAVHELAERGVVAALLGVQQGAGRRTKLLAHQLVLSVLVALLSLSFAGM